MRNLKKILAMALALVMSLSLMATAGAAETTAATGTSQYQTAAEVLQGLKVIRGDENGFRFQDSITRVEAAALVYRIATSDVEDAQKDLYTNHPFSDVPAGYWGAGYISYGYNAEIIKGNGNGTVTPDEPVTGYATMAMILRTMGYGKNGEFEGDNWEIQTAAIAKREGLLDGVAATDEARLGQPAPRELVFKILFNALLNETVDFDARFPNVYPKTGETLGYKAFKLEEIEGIVVANEFADLNSDRVLDEGKTHLQVADETAPRTLSYSTKITDIGESRLVYTQNTSKVLSIADTGDNKVTEFGHACDISTKAKFETVAEMPAADDIEYFVNFDPWTADGYDCDQRLEFSVVLYGIRAETAFDGYKGINISEIAADDPRYSVEVLTGTDVTKPTDWTDITDNTVSDYASDGDYNYPVRYTKIIWAGQTITKTDLTVLESIFGMADNVQNNVLDANRITGDVYVGTKSTGTTSTDEERDLSNTISYKKFFEDYINDNSKELNWGESFNGDWVKFVDNDGDGKCDYAFYTWSFLDEAIHTYTNRNGDTVTEFNGFDDNTYDVPNGRYTVRYLDNDGNDTDEVPATGDKVVAAYIDHQILVEPALDETVTVSEYSWRNDEVETDKGTYGQSGIGNATDMMEQIDKMDDKVEYVVYFDHFGYIRAFELPGGTQYALVTELYYTNAQQGNLKQDWPMTVELTMPNDEGKAETAEYNAASGAGTFRANAPWLLVNNLASTSNYHNWLQPAIAHLGVSRTVNGVPLGEKKNSNNPDIFDTTFSTVWRDDRQLVKNLTSWSDGDEFNYGVQTYFDVSTNARDKNQAKGTASFTNVAIVNINGDDASLTGAAQLKLNKDGSIATRDANYVYAVDYIQLDRNASVVEDAVRYPIGGTSAYIAANNYYVNAVHDTEFYIVFDNGVYYFKDFVNMPKLDSADIHAAYAVARDTSADNATNPYWVADVIVYEMYNWDDEALTSVSLAYYTPTRLSGTVQQVETLNNKYGPMVTLTPGGKTWNAADGQWGKDWDGYGFYALYNDTEPVDGVMTASKIQRIGIGAYASNKIYAGTVTREAYIAGAGWYIDVDMGNGEIASVEITDKIYSVTQKRAQSDDWYGYNEAATLRYQNLNNSQVKAGDKVIWVNDGAVKAAPAASTATLNKTKFVVDMGHNIKSYPDVYAGLDLLTDTPKWLIDWTQNPVTGAVTIPGEDGSTTTGEWQKIMNEQVNTPTTQTTEIDFDLRLTDPETIQFAYDGTDLTDVLPASETYVTLSLPGKDLPIVELTVKTDAVIAAITPAAGSTWKVAEVGSISGGYKVVLYNSTSVSGRAAGNPDDVGVIYSVATVDALIEEAESGSLTLAEIEELTEVLEAINTARTAAAANSDIQYGDLTDDKDISDTLTTLSNATTGALETAQGEAEDTIDNYESAGIAALTEAKQAELTAKATTAKEKIGAAEDMDTINAAIAEYKTAVDAALKAANPNLETARTEALADVAAYKAAEIAALTGDFKTAVTTAKTTADSKINAAASEATITAAVNAYKEAVDAQIIASANAAANAELAALKKAAKDAVEAKIGTAVAGDEGVLAAKEELLDYIDVVDSAASLALFYKDGALVADNELVMALDDAIKTALAGAVDLKKAKTAAIEVVTAAITAVTGAADDGAVKTAKTALVDKINTCTSIDGTGEGGAATATDIGYYVNTENSELTGDSAEVTALKAAIVAVAKTNTTNEAADHLATEKAKLTTEELETLDVESAQTALTTAVEASDATVDSLATALNTYKTAVTDAVKAIIDARQAP